MQTYSRTSIPKYKKLYSKIDILKVYLILKYLFWNSYSILHLLAKSLSPSCNLSSFTTSSPVTMVNLESCNLSSFTATSPVTTVNLESHCSGHPKIIKPSFNHNRINTLHTGSTVEHVEVDEVELDVWMKM